MLKVTDYYLNNKILVIKLVLLTLGVGVLEVAGIFAIIPYVDIMFGQSDNSSSFITEIIISIFFYEDKVLISLFFLVFYLVRGLVLAGIVFKIQILVGDAHAKLLTNLFKVSFEKRVYSKEQSSKLIRIYSRDSLVFIYSFLVQASVLAAEIIIFIFLFFGIVFYQTEAIWLFPIISLFVFLGYYMIKKKISTFSKVVQKYDSRMIKGIQESHNANEEILIYNSFSGFSKKIQNIFYHKTKAYAKTESLMMMPRIMLETILVVLVVLVIYYITQIYSEDIEPSVAIFIILAGFRFLPMANKVTQSLGWFRNGLVSLEELNRIYKHPSRSYHININKTKLNSYENKIAVEVQNVSSNIFLEEANNKVSFNAYFGKLLCIVGETGSGKSTLLKQIAGLIDTHGHIKFNRIENHADEDLVLSYVPQSPAIINDTLKNNIIFLRESLIGNEVLNDILRIVKLKKRVINSDRGLETILSESGNNLSGGEKYRVCLARALLNNPNILIMDEPTSSLDKTTSVEVIQNIRSFLPNTAIIISSHDQDIIDLADQIVRL